MDVSSKYAGDVMIDPGKRNDLMSNVTVPTGEESEYWTWNNSNQQ
jgi:hypothetical protein